MFSIPYADSTAVGSTHFQIKKNHFYNLMVLVLHYSRYRLVPDAEPLSEKKNFASNHFVCWNKRFRVISFF